MVTLTIEDMDAKRRKRFATSAIAVAYAREQVRRMLHYDHRPQEVDPAFFHVRDANDELLAFVGLMPDRRVLVIAASSHLLPGVRS